MKRVLLLLTLCLPWILKAQFAPQAGLLGSTAIHKDSNLFLAWGDSCIVTRGWMNVADTTLGKASNGSDIAPKNVADNSILSLGDGGEIIYYFQNPVTNGLGFDFAIFENGFRNPADSNQAYLELATVEVSNDGMTYYNFSAESYTDTVTQIAGTGIYMDCRKIHNLAGKYISEYGTPFDLEELSMQFGLDVNNIHYIKIKDVIGTLDPERCTRDYYEQKINDPYPTDFPTGGFDIDAIGIIHTLFPTGLNDMKAFQLQLYPNPATHSLRIQSSEPIASYMIHSMDGRFVQAANENVENNITISHLPSGTYLLHAKTYQGQTAQFRFVKW
jgi:hypothetical protein